MGVVNKFMSSFQRSKVKRFNDVYNLNDWLQECDGYDGSYLKGYRSLRDTPEIKSAIEKIAEIISTMSIMLMKNTDNGDVRIKDGLSRKIDIEPCKEMSRQLFISWVVQQMLLEGNAFVKVNISSDKDREYIDYLTPLPNAKFMRIGDKLKIVDGKDVYLPEDILIFRYNPKIEDPLVGESAKIILKDLISLLGNTNKLISEFSTTKITPTVIVKVSALAGDLKSETGRRKIANRFLYQSKRGEPWIIPDLMDVETVKPLTLNDIAVHDTVNISKKAISSIIGIPSFMLGVGEFNKQEYDYFIKTKVAVICKAIEEELTSKLLFDPSRYFVFNRKNLINYDLKELGDLYMSLYKSGIVTGNEVRDVLGMSPLEQLDSLVILENYIPVEKVGKQNKLKEE